MTINLGIPQIIWLVLVALGLVTEIVYHGKPREPYNAYAYVIKIIIYFLLLYYGGFFG